MKIISRRAHGVMDYLVGILLIAAPWVLNFADRGPETWVPVILGVGTMLYSFMTNYELGMVHVIPFRTHLAIDVLAGIFLAASPWIFAFSDMVYMPHLVFGILEVGVVALTDPEPHPAAERRHHHPV
jgi:hypothetical protein